MKKTEIVQAIMHSAKLDLYHAEEAFDAFVDHIGNALARGESVSLVGFGSFTVKQRAERTGRNPQTGESITIAASNQVSFKAGKALKDKVN